MITLNKEMAFISFYLAEKEYFFPESLRQTLNYVNYLIVKKGKDKALAIHLANKRCIEKFGVDFGKNKIRSDYNSRSAHIKNAKDKYKIWALELRERNAGKKKKLCECGCGKEVVKKNNRFIHGHHRRVLSQEVKELNAKHMRDKRAEKSDNKIIDIKSYKNL